jgi:hypothetical protein
MELERSSRIIGVFTLILSVIAVIGSLLVIANGTIDFLVAGMDIEYKPLFNELEYEIWNYYNLESYVLFELFLNDLFSNIGSRLFLSSSSSIYAVIILILGVVGALLGIIEITGNIAVVMVILTLILAIALIILPIVEYYQFKDEIFETSKALYFIFFFPWYLDIFWFLLSEITTTVAIGFYLTVISAAVLLVICIIILVAQRKRY